MKLEQVKEIANAVLYEGYMLYPYRPSAIKNRQRWSIGIIYPREYSEANGAMEPWQMQTECLIAGQGKQDITLHVHIRFLHLLLRTIMQPTASTPLQAASTSEWSLASRVAHEPYEEGIEREISRVDYSLHALLASPQVVAVDFPGQRLEDDGIMREQYPINGAIRLSAEVAGEDLFKVRVQIENQTSDTSSVSNRHNAVLLQSFVSTHTILQVEGGAFISLLEPPEALKTIAEQCRNTLTWPVLVGNEGDTNVLLSSPIILYDYPQIAPESPGALFDGTEIDELLILRILTLTDEEKAEMREGDARVREILERTEALTPEQLMKLHGTIRSLRPISEGGD